MQEFIELKKYGIWPDRGFLPKPDPLECLPKKYKIWEEVAYNLPKLLSSGNFQKTVDSMPVLDASFLKGAELHRAMLLLSFFGHGYVWEQWKDKPCNFIPASIAVPWHYVAKKIGRPPVLSYASYALFNWRRLDPEKPIELGNIVTLQNFLGGIDEEWFILVHVQIEAEAGSALYAVAKMQQAIVRKDFEEVENQLKIIVDSLQRMYFTLCRMPDNCDPYIYYRRVRPYLHGWKNHPALPDGIIYQGVDEYAGKPQKFSGESGAQSTIIPVLDAAFGISHADDPLRTYLMEMRRYMPVEHRHFLEEVEIKPNIRDFIVKNNIISGNQLRELYNECILWLAEFRTKHLEYAALYINKQAENKNNPIGVGTGGTPFMAYLKKHRDETLKHLI